MCAQLPLWSLGEEMEEKMIEEGGKREGGASFSGCNRDLISIECSERKLN